MVIGLQPDKDNIKYLVKPCPSVDVICSLLAEEIVKQRSNMPKLSCFVTHYNSVLRYILLLEGSWDQTIQILLAYQTFWVFD